MPFAGYKTFSECVAAQKRKGKSDESARKICGALQKKAEGQETSEEDIIKLQTEMWIKENVLNIS